LEIDSTGKNVKSWTFSEETSSFSKVLLIGNKPSAVILNAFCSLFFLLGTKKYASPLLSKKRNGVVDFFSNSLIWLNSTEF